MSRNNKRIATLWDNNSAEANDSQPGEQQAFYAGGSEHSGQQILGPSADANRLFNQLGQSAAARATDRPVEGENVLTVTLWRNGFTVGDDPQLRDLNSQEGRNFMETIGRGDVPPEIASQYSNGSIDINLINKVHEEFKPMRKVQAFSGEGHRLGVLAPETQADASGSTSVAAAAVPKGQDEDRAQANKSSIVLDESQPVTVIQVRLADNSRLIVRANLTWTISDLLVYITEVRPDYAATEFVLATTFPAKELTDVNETIADAKLANSSVVQKIRR